MPFPLAAVLGGASILGKLFSGGAKGAASERQSANDFQQRQDQLATSRYGIQQSALANLLGLQERATMDRAQMGVAAPSARLKQAILGSLLQNLQSARVSPPKGVNMAQISGGLDPSRLLNAGARAGGGELQRQALLALLTKSDVPAQTDYATQGMLQAPAAGNYQKPGGLEKALTIGGLLGSLGGAVGQMIPNKPRVP